MVLGERIVGDGTDGTVLVSEARLNDLVYMTLKYLFFVPSFGENACPRECDIRVCMNMVCPSTWKGNALAAMILLPDEKAPTAHELTCRIRLRDVLDRCVEYLQDHWLKDTVESAYSDPDVRSKFAEWFDEMATSIMSAPEEQCGPSGTPS